MEVLGGVLLACSLIALLFGGGRIGQLLVFIPASVFALYSLMVALFVNYEHRPA